MTTTLSRGAIAACLAIAAGAASAATPAWLQPAYDAGQTFYNPNETTLKPGNVKQLVRVSSQQPGFNWVGQTTHAGGALFLCSDRDGLGSLDEATGAERWTSSALGGTCTAAILAGANLYATAWHDNVGSFTNTLTALAQADAGVLWQVFGPVDPKDKPSWLTFNLPTLSQNVLYVSSGRSLVASYRADNGRLRWRIQTGFLNNQTAVAGALAYTTTWGEGGPVNQVFANNTSDGTLAWSRPTDASISEYPATVSGGRVFVASDSGHVRAFDAAAGTPLWDVAFPGYPSSPLVATPQAVIYTSAHSTLVAADPATGATLWTTKLKSGDGVDSNLVQAGNVLYAMAGDFSSNMRLVAFDARTGKQLLRSTDVTGGSWANVSVVGGKVYVAVEGSLIEYGLPQ